MRARPYLPTQAIQGEEIEPPTAPADRDAPEDATAPSGRSLRPLPLLSDEEMETRPKPAQIVDGMFLERSTSALVGEPGIGKGLLVVDLLYRVALGMPYHGHATQQGSSVYVAMERQGGLGARIRAWKAHHQRPGAAPVWFIPIGFSLFDPAGAMRLLERLADVPGPVRFVAIDTYPKAILPGDENATDDAGILLQNVQRITETGPNVLLVHHLNAGGLRERGNTALRGDVDTLVMVKKGTADDTISLECEKQNELAPFAPIVLRKVEIGDSAVVDTAAAVSEPMLTRSQLEVLKSLRIVAMGSDASASAWLKASGLADRTFYDARSRLVAKGYVSASKDRRPRYSLTIAGESAFTADCGDTADSLRSQSDNSNCGHCGGGYKPPASAVKSPQEPPQLFTNGNGRGAS